MKLVSATSHPQQPTKAKNRKLNDKEMSEVITLLKDLNEETEAELLEAVGKDSLLSLMPEVEKLKIEVCGCPPFQSNHDGYCSSPEPGWEQYNQALGDVIKLIQSRSEATELANLAVDKINQNLERAGK